MNIKNFTFFESYKEVIEQLKNDEEKMKFIYAIYQFIFFGIEPVFEEKSLLKIGWLGIINSLITSKNRGYHNLSTKQKQNKNKIKTNKKQIPSTSTSNNILIKDKYIDYVLLNKEEVDKLNNKLGKDKTQEYITKLNNYIGQTGKNYKSHYFTILNWYNKDVGKIETPNWFNEEIETKECSEEEKIELEKMLGEFKGEEVRN